VSEQNVDLYRAYKTITYNAVLNLYTVKLICMFVASRKILSAEQPVWTQSIRTSSQCECPSLSSSSES